MAVERSLAPHATHEVFNQAVPLQNHNPYTLDAALTEGVARGGAQWHEDALLAFGETTGRPDVIELGFLANKHKPELRTHDRYGHRIDEAVFHPAYHELMRLGIEAGMHSLPWNQPRPGAHVARAAIHYLLDQVESGVGCPITMTFAAVPALRLQPDVAAEWVPRVSSTQYDQRMRPAPEKAGCTMGMAMTEKQGGSDVRANTTQAVPLGAGGPGGEYWITGHKWFCSAPMCDAFLTLAQTDAGLSCFIVPRWLPDGTRNRFAIQRLKDKLGNHSNASSEIEYHQTWARMVGEEGRGVPTIIEMVNHTRLDCVIGSAAIMRQALTQALHHATHRSAFGKLLKDQPLMRNVLADLALESEAATTLMSRLAQLYDQAAADESVRPAARIITAISKYWVCKRGPGAVYESLECLGGAGYVEETILPRLYREIPLASIWEGSGNVMCLDVLRAMAREPESIPAFQGELMKAAGANAHYDRALKGLETELSNPDDLQTRARRLVERMAVLLQACQLLQFAPAAVSETFCRARMAGEGGMEFGTLPSDAPFGEILERAYAPIAG
jgi:putative acyl-CoA dehydrogenase